MSISIPIADLRQVPHDLCQDFSYDARRESQLLFGEKVEILERKDEWLYVHALEQGCCGWIHASEYTKKMFSPRFVVCNHDLPFSFGTFLDRPLGRPIPQTPSRQQLVEDALLFLDLPYLWGGRGSYREEPVSSVDCSGLINLLYRAQGMLIPRNTLPQSLFATETKRLLPGDLIYLGDPVSHVIMKLDEERFIEAPETGKKVRLVTWGEEVWEEGGMICFFDREKKYLPHYRTLIE